MPESIGVVAIQGDFERHIDSLTSAGAKRVVEVRTPEDLSTVDRLIIPGGESTTVGKLMDRFGLGQAIIQKVESGMPVWGTCMGMILLAKDIEDHSQYTLGLLDVSVQRNAFGAQVYSFEDSVDVEGFNSPVTAVFIRAPVVTRVGTGVQEIARYQNKVVGVRQGLKVGTAFHPELTDDTRFHSWFLALK